MTRIAWNSLLLGGLLVLADCLSAQDDFLILDEVTIEGQIREPSVAIISSRLRPEISDFRLERSFVDQARRPNVEFSAFNPELALGTRILLPRELLERQRVLKPNGNKSDANGKSTQDGQE